MLLGRKRSITPEQAAAGLANGELVLVDVRQTFEMERGRIHGAINIPLGQLRGSLPELGRDRPVRRLSAPSPTKPAPSPLRRTLVTPGDLAHNPHDLVIGGFSGVSRSV
jgi:hypothetical protein